LEKEKRLAIYAIYGFVRLADEIVDSFHGYDRAFLLERLNEDLQYALKNNVSINTVLVAFADTVKKYRIKKEHIHAFMNSMKYDLTKAQYTDLEDLGKYIYGSADVVGLMCLKVFSNGEETLYKKLEIPARKLGSAFQKVNFLRDLRYDIQELGRYYFPEISNSEFSERSKKLIEESIQKDFDEAWTGVIHLPGRSKLAVALAYFYYLYLFKKIRRTSMREVLSKRIRIPNLRKYLIILKVIVMYKIKWI
jgi:phytoene/squalene synthetase